MLILKDIVKDYTAGDTTVKALKGVSINFRESELVSILGPSGCGKTRGDKKRALFPSFKKVRRRARQK